MNKIQIFTVLCFIVFTYSAGQQLIPKEACVDSLHYTDPEFTCCASGTYLSPVKDLSKSCNQQLPPLGDDKIIKTAWTNYQCAIKSKLGGKELTLESFGNLMKENLPENIRNKIAQKIKANDNDNKYENSMYPEFQELMGIRRDYYRIEKQVCNGDDYMDDGPKMCFSWKQRYHASGDCCGDVPIPYQLFPEPFFSHWQLSNYTAVKLLNIGGTYEYDNLTYSNNLVQCFKTAKLLLSNVITEAELRQQVLNLTGPDYTKISYQLLPTFISQPIRDEMMAYMVLNITQEPTLIQIIDNPIEHYISTYEFTKVDANATRFLYWRCEADRILSARMKNFNITPWCQ